MSISLNDTPIIAGKISMPVSGVWTASITLPGSDIPTGNVSLGDGVVSLVGSVVDANRDGSRTNAMVRGGNGDLSAVVSARHYTAATVRLVMGDMASDSGFGVSPASEPRFANASLPFWTTVSLPVGYTMETLAESLGTRWGVDSDGKLLLGYDASDEATGDFRVISSKPGLRRYTVAPEGLGIRPGMTQQGSTIKAVEYRLSTGLRATYWI